MAKGGQILGRKGYSELEKEQALAYMVTHINAHTGRPNFTQCEKDLPYNAATLRRWWNDRDNVAVDLVEARKEWIPTVIAECQRVALEAVIQAGNKIQNANAGEAAKVAGILIDKQALLQGLPTSIVEESIKNMSDEERQARIDELEKKRAERMARRNRIVDSIEGSV